MPESGRQGGYCGYLGCGSPVAITSQCRRRSRSGPIPRPRHARKRGGQHVSREPDINGLPRLAAPIAASRESAIRCHMPKSACRRGTATPGWRIREISAKPVNTGEARATRSTSAGDADAARFRCETSTCRACRAHLSRHGPEAPAPAHGATSSTPDRVLHDHPDHANDASTLALPGYELGAIKSSRRPATTGQPRTKIFTSLPDEGFATRAVIGQAGPGPAVTVMPTER
jgi:hypothetical protein